ncbi:MAG: ATP synthase F1 subunit gamma [Candidatus Levybacteria bacterium RIFOXYA1_FULL_41_10]|nr:MAG: ATP synthase gamma chain [Candidatus Levybacteria bacterium GW2011_GWB1_36_18]KKR17978.1 MAG: ATP synthase gamma chain [Candidatus Levybacteria bacterium GW2011_GWA1_39_32]KKR51590.1 MAG: ATP synthase gamma chain [Candidatus Levybacteria bacterium GW2011_GWC1_40_19]KKR73772.1 MAG: ATP synthase gamma chain [Candidatus Levybacteria bacterium GW2011_GWC2_40_7]KKR95231.1 MAG: ATP synthase gamma chain [Candidatus Levybacteria bacterium GW2011_GWA2_41_15]OGH20872.1 MAG: ATP synthase F1 subun
MANLLSLKRRIKTAQNVSKTTKAMQMIAASKLKRAQNAALSARPYVDKLSSLSKNISEKVDLEDRIDYMKPKATGSKKLMLIIAPDKGLCGGLVTNLSRELLNFYKDNKNSNFITVGKKANGAVGLIGGEIEAAFDFGTTLPSYDKVYPVMSIIDDLYLSGKTSEVYIINSNFKSVFTQEPGIKKLLPVRFEVTKKKSFITTFEPNAQELLPGLIRHYLEMTIFQSFLEGYLSEQAARMLAMQNATNNARDIIEELKLVYNKSRQEKITNEILDIAGGVFTHA